jgi:hypothetical protein
MRAYSRWIPDKARLQIVMTKGSQDGKDIWTIELRYGPAQQDWMSLTYDGTEGECFTDFLTMVTAWEEYDNTTFAKEVRAAKRFKKQSRT